MYKFPFNNLKSKFVTGGIFKTYNFEVYAYLFEIKPSCTWLHADREGGNLNHPYDLAKLYEIETSQLKRAVRRNIDRFPEDFMVELTKKELDYWRCQFVTSNSNKMGLRYKPMAFTEQGVAMLSRVLRSKRSIHVNIQKMRVFIRFKQVVLDNEELRKELANLCAQFVFSTFFALPVLLSASFQLFN